ncbi:choice-of-anchor P family protein [Actinokineospora inagensis]|uniref:choice-of-anchor P family protein n=1 Tax=Actinokineospora inagensis TaxID=103730 RepID=UPI0003F7D35E|nr:choice-of-anchor P family protein [Actinokineospora inagensis]
MDVWSWARGSRFVMGIVAVGLVGSGLAVGATTAAAEPVAPRPPVVVFAENFENGQGSAITWVNRYVGAAPLGQTYTADPVWLASCNGIIASELNQATDPPGAGCGGWWPRVKDLAGVLGDWADGSGATNHAVTAYTHTDPGAGRTQLQSTAPIPISAPNRFIAFSVDVAEQNCYGQHTKYAFYLLDGATAIPASTRPIAPCEDATTVINGTAVGTFHSDAPVLFAGTSLGLRLVNQQPSGNGNDSAFDNVRVLDVTPQVGIAFDPNPVEVGKTSNLTLTVTNTTELSAKAGWSFTLALPPGLTQAPTVATTCAGTTFTPVAGAFSATGTLPAGAESCTITLPVRAARTGTYTSCGGDFAPLVGLNPPGCATLKVVGPTLAYAAHAHGVRVSTLLGPLPPLAPADLTCTTTPTTDSATLATASVLGSTSALVDTATGTTDPDGLRTAHATSHTAVVNLLAGLITADELHSEAIAATTPTGAITVSGSSGLTNLRVAGVPVIPKVNLNLTIPLVGSITTDEQIPGPNGITVNALHVRLLAGTDLVVGQTTASLGTPCLG